MKQPQRIFALAATIAATTACGAWAGPVDQAITQNGGSAPSGTWREGLVNAVDELLLEFNNDITFDIAVSLDPTAVLDYVPLQDRYQVGEIMYSVDDQTRMIYDRLAVRAVVHVIGYHSGQLPYDDLAPVMLLTENNDLLAAMAPMGLPAGSGSPGSDPIPAVSRPTSMLSVPEPATVALIGLGLLLLLPRRRPPATCPVR
jgi:hypothetical protein